MGDKDDNGQENGVWESKRGESAENGLISANSADVYFRKTK